MLLLSRLVRVIPGAAGASIIFLLACPTAQSQSVLHTFSGGPAGIDFGFSVSGAGDVNGDGFDDVIIGDPRDLTTAGHAGSACVRSGADGSVLYSFDGDSPSDSFGGSVSGAGDVNGDGYADLIVGASGDDNNGPQARSVVQ